MPRAAPPALRARSGSGVRPSGPSRSSSGCSTLAAVTVAGALLAPAASSAAAKHRVVVDRFSEIDGKVWLGTKPGSGTYVHDTGRIVMTLDTNEPLLVAGPHEAFLAGGVDIPVCAALAG
jgi:hypothetical protein